MMDLAKRMKLAELRHFLPQLGKLLGRELRPFRLRLRPSSSSSHSSSSSSSCFPILGQFFRRGIHGYRGSCRCFEPVDQTFERARDGVGGRGEQLPQDQRHELALAGREGVERRPLQVVRNQIVEPLLRFGWHELLHEGVTVGVLDVLQHLPAQRALAEGLQAFLQLGKIGVVAEARKAGAEALEVAEGKVVDDADQAVEFQKGVLKRRGREQHLGKRSHGLLDGDGDLVGVLVDVTQAGALRR